MRGWIKLHRKFLEWEWWDDENTTRVFLYLLLSANHKTKRYRGITLDPGQLVTGRKKIAEKTRLSERNVRTVIDHLKSTNEIAIKTTSRYSIITITNWNEYQQTDQQSDQQPTSNRPTSDQQVTTIKNDKNVKNEKNIYPSGIVRLHEKPDVVRLSDLLLDRIIECNPEHRYVKNKPVLRSWDTQIDRAMRLDGRTPEQLEYMIRYIFEKETPVAQFWASNIESGGKLRAKFDNVAGQIKRERNNQGRRHGYEEPDAAKIYEQSERILRQFAEEEV